MSWTDEELDGLVREAAGTSNVEYKEAYWHEMEAMLGETSTSKIGMWWWLSGITLLVGWSTLFVGSINGVFGPNDTLRANNNTQLKQQFTATNVKVIDENEKNSKSLVSDENVLTEEPSQRKATDQNVIVNEKQKPQVASLYAPSTIKKKEVVKVKPRKPKRSNSNLHSDINNELKSNDKNSLSERRSLIESNLDNPLDENQMVNQGLLTTKTWSNEIENTPLNPFNKLPIIASKRIGFYVGMNTGLGQSYAMTKTNNEIYQFSLNGGVEFYKGKWAFGTGLGIRQQFTQNLKVVSRRQFYSFGSVHVDQNMSYDRLVFADLNLTASRRFGRSELGINVSPTFMLGARLTYLQTTEEIVGSQKTMSNTANGKNEYVRSDNFNAFGLNMGIHYSYTLMKNISIEAGVSSRIAQPMLKANFDGEKRNLPVMLELGLKKRF